MKTLPLQRRTFMLAGVGLVWSAAGALTCTTAHANDLVLNQAAPPLTLHCVDGRSIATSELTGKVVIVTFWATYCDPCREELALLSDYVKKHADKDLVVLGFCIDPPDNLDEVVRVAKTLSFPVGMLGTPYAGGYGRIWRMPVSFVINRAGHLVYNGWKDDNPAWTRESLHRIVDPLLA